MERFTNEIGTAVDHDPMRERINTVTATESNEMKKDKGITKTVHQSSPEKAAFGQILGPNWHSYFCNDEAVKQILKAAGIEDQDFVNIHRTCTIDNKRLAVIVNTMKKDTLYSNRVIIDVIMGEPTWDQMMDVTFYIGRGCNPRIIVCDRGDPELFGLDPMVDGFVQISNECGLATFVLGAQSKMEGMELTLLEEGDMSVPLKIDRFPNRAGFHHTEFMFYYCLASDGELPLYREFCDWPCNSWVLGVEGTDLEATYPVWDQSGVFMLITAKSEKGQKELKWLLENKMNFLRKTFELFRVDYDNESGLPMELDAKVWDRPFTDFIFADEPQKRELARKVADFNTCQDREISDLLKEFTSE